MTQEKALEEFKAMFPEDADYLAAERGHKIGYNNGFMDQFYLWSYVGSSSKIVASSNRSWEHALAIAKSDNEDCWEQDNSPVDAPSEVKEVA